VSRSLRTLVVAVVLGLGLATPPAAAQSDPSPTTTAFDLSDCTGAITRPGCGEEPEESGDRGGAAQIGLFFFLLAGTAAGLGYVAYRVRAGTRARTETVTGDWS
jgi:hypothetical protein